MRKLIYLLGTVLLTMTFSSCDLDINKDPNYPTDVKADKYFASGQMFVASAIGGDLQLIGSMWSQHYAQNNGSNQYTNIDSYNLPNSNTYITRSWSLLYAGALPDLKLAMDKAEANGDLQYLMAAKIMTAFCYHTLVEAYGDIPYTEALDFVKYPAPHFDDAKTVNQKIIETLDAALALEEGAAAAIPTMDDNDFVFGGDIALWAQFARSLKFKILMRDFNANTAAIQALLGEELLSTDARIAVFEDKENNSNPLYENDRRKLNTQNNLRGSSTLSRFLFKNNDPRAAVFMEPLATADAKYGLYVGLPQGGYTLGTSVKSSRAVIEATDPVYFMSYAEVEFLKAEANVKLNNAAAAKVNYDNAVTAAFDRWPETEGMAATFIAPGAAYAFDQTSTQTMLESIWRQSWIAGVRSQGWNTFTEINRTGYPKAGAVDSRDATYVVGQLAPSINSVLAVGANAEFPKRLIYPKTSSDYNVNTPAGITIKDKMWWQN